LIARVREEVNRGVSTRDMAYLSFSVAAKDVIKERLHLKDTDVRWFRTIHGACAKSLGLSGCILDSRNYVEFERVTGMRITPDDYDQEFGGTDFNVALRAHNLSLNMGLPLLEVVRMLPDHPNLQITRLTRFIEDYTKFKQQRGLFDYTDMLTHYAERGEPLPIRVGIVDEAQDNSWLQWRCVGKMLANCDRVYMAGDDDQAIYTFIGASEYGFLEHDADEEEVLKQSFRVPLLIGNKADNIIGRIAHRKDKGVVWKDDAGRVTRINRDAMDMDWKRLIAEFPRTEDGPGIMALTRHRKGALDFSKDLRMRGVPHSLHGETMNTWPEARLLHSIYSLNDRKSITPRAAIMLCKALGKSDTQFRDLSRRDRVDEIDGVSLRSLSWLEEFSSSFKTRSRFKALSRLVRSEGYEALAKDPVITVSTMHGSKGKEAPLVIISPECTNIVKQNAQTPTEIRLAYVALTRAMQQCHLIMPRTENYIHHFF
jgi:superfamily I DNA/RNA helicase